MKKIIVIKQTQTNKTGFYIVKIIDAEQYSQFQSFYYFNEESEKTAKSNAIQFADNYQAEEILVWEKEI